MAASTAAGTVPAGTILLLGVGDTHGDFGPLFRVAREEPGARALLQVGDLTAGKPGRERRADDDPATLDQLPLPLVWVHGNHEHWPALGFSETGERATAAIAGTAAIADTSSTAAMASTASTTSATSATSAMNATAETNRISDRTAGDTAKEPDSAPGIHLWPGRRYVVPGTRVDVVGLPGNFAPTWYEKPKPFPGDRVRHFNQDDLAVLDRFSQPSVLLMHEAFRGQGPGRLGYMGIAALRDLVRRLRPRVVLTGHHHTFAAVQHGPTLAIALPRAQEGYVRLSFTPGGALKEWEFVPFPPGEFGGPEE